MPAPDARTVLILGGTAEAAAIARALGERFGAAAPRRHVARRPHGTARARARNRADRRVRRRRRACRISARGRHRAPRRCDASVRGHDIGPRAACGGSGRRAAPCRGAAAVARCRGRSLDRGAGRSRGRAAGRAHRAARLPHRRRARTGRVRGTGRHPVRRPPDRAAARRTAARRCGRDRRAAAFHTGRRARSSASSRDRGRGREGERRRASGKVFGGARGRDSGRAGASARRPSPARRSQASPRRSRGLRTGWDEGGSGDEVADGGARIDAHRGSCLPRPLRRARGIPGTPWRTRHPRNETNQVADLLAKGDHDPDALESESGRTALDYAASFDNLAMAKLLLGHGAHVDARDKLGNTALHWAAERGIIDFVRLLIANKATVDATNRQGITPLMTAAAQRAARGGAHPSCGRRRPAQAGLYRARCVRLGRRQARRDAGARDEAVRVSAAAAARGGDRGRRAGFRKTALRQARGPRG